MPSHVAHLCGIWRSRGRKRSVGYMHWMIDKYEYDRAISIERAISEKRYSGPLDHRVKKIYGSAGLWLLRSIDNQGYAIIARLAASPTYNWKLYNHWGPKKGNARNLTLMVKEPVKGEAEMPYTADARAITYENNSTVMREFLIV